jgi:hypothetical protein
MARSAAQRGVEFRERRKEGLHVRCVVIDRADTIAAGLMTEAEFDDPERCKQILSDWFDEVLQTKKFPNVVRR